MESKKEDKEQIIISKSPVIQCGEVLEIYADSDVDIKVYPDFESTPEYIERVSKDGIFTKYRYKYKSKKIDVVVEQVKATEYEIKLGELTKDLYDVYMDIEYIAEMADLYIDEVKVADEFYAGEVWQVGLRKFGFANKYTLRLNPLVKNAPIYFEETPKFESAQICEVREISAKIIEKIIIVL